jgi:hypothetical protein
MADNKPGMPGAVRPRHNVVDQTRRSDPQFNMNSVLNDVRDMPVDYLQKYEKTGIPNLVNATNLTNKKKSSFQITSVTAVKHSEVHEGDADSMDDLDETHTEDVSSEVLDWSKTTDIEPDPSSAEETLSNLGCLVVEVAIIKERTDTTSRFKVVKIASKEPFRRGRWWCSDFSDDSTADRDKERASSDVKNEEFSVPVSENSSAASSVHYVPDQQNEHEEMKDPVGMFALKMDGGPMIIDDDSDYELQQRQPTTVMKVMPDSGQPNMTDMYQQKAIPQNAVLLPNNNLTSVSQTVKEFTNAPPLIQNVPKPQQSHVAPGNKLPSDQLNSASSNVPGSSQPPQASHLMPSQTSGAATIPQPGMPGTIGNNASELNSGKKIQDSTQGTQGMNSSKMVAGAPPGVAQGQLPGNGSHAINGSVASSKPDYHQSSRRDASSNILMSRQTMTASTVTNSQQTSSAKATSDYNVTNSRNLLPRIQVTTQSGYDNESGAMAEEAVVANENRVAKETTKDDHLDMIESAEKTQFLLEQMVSSRAGIPVALGSPIKDGDCDERYVCVIQGFTFFYQSRGTGLESRLKKNFQGYSCSFLLPCHLIASPF